MKRRDLLAGTVALAGVSLAAAGCVSARTATTKARPGEPGWPTDADWSALGRAVGSRLAPVSMPNLASDDARSLVTNPIWVGDQAGLTESSGWLDGWTSSPSTYVVRAASASDVAAAVRFAQRHNIRLVVRGGGHSYLGGSNAPDSLLVWTRDMEAIELHDAFTPSGCASNPVPAVSVGAGCMWGRVYDEVTTRGGRYVQGGGCTTVGVAGLVLGGGFGSFSKAFGLAAASLLEAEIVTADSQVRIVNACRAPDLFWALKGGGGGTFGVVTRLTLRTHDLPETFGGMRLTVQARSDAAFRRLLERFLAEYAANLFNPHWGEQVRATPGNALRCEMSFSGLSEISAAEAWRGLRDFVDASPEDYQISVPFLVLTAPAQRLWDKTFIEQAIPGLITSDDRPGGRTRDFWWSGDRGQVGVFWHGYHSAWLPASLLEGDGRARLADAWFEASRHWDVSFHFNKGLAGADAAALSQSRDTSINPQVLDAFALAIIAGGGSPVFPSFPRPDLVAARRRASRIAQAMAALKAAAPDAGNYLSECDYFNDNWREASWGVHAERLNRIKRRYDPHGLFIVHHGVGSEA